MMTTSSSSWPMAGRRGARNGGTDRYRGSPGSVAAPAGSAEGPDEVRPWQAGTGRAASRPRRTDGRFSRRGDDSTTGVRRASETRGQRSEPPDAAPLATGPRNVPELATELGLPDDSAPRLLTALCALARERLPDSGRYANGCDASLTRRAGAESDASTRRGAPRRRGHRASLRSAPNEAPGDPLL
jgi:hypothetical protein